MSTLPQPSEFFPRPALLSAAAAIAACVGSLAAPAAAQSLLAAPQAQGASGNVLFANGLACGDLDGDGAPDVVSWTSTQALWSAGTPDGPFGVTSPFLGGGPLLAGALADVNGDGRLDALTSAPGASALAVRLGLGGGAFGTALVLPTSRDVTAILVVDVNADDALDLVAGLAEQSRIAIFLGNGTGLFPTAIDVASAFGVVQVAAGDLNDDGVLDLALLGDPPGFGAQTASVLTGTGDGHFEPPLLVTAAAYSLAVADFSADGIADLAIARDTGSIAIYAGDAALSLPEAFSVPSVTAVPLLSAGDVNADGRVDLVQVGGVTVATQLQLPGGGLGAAIGGACAVGPRPMLLADADRDGRLDVVSLHLSLGGVVDVTFGNGDGTWRTSSLPGTAAQPAAAMNDAVVADFDGDGRPDLIEAFAGTPSTRLRRGALDGSFGPVEPLDLGPNVVRLFAGDSTGDGLLDLVVLHGGTSVAAKGSLQLAVGDGALGFTLLPTVAPAFQLVDAAPTDYDGDGRTDVLAFELTAGGGVLQLLRNVGDGSFAHVYQVVLSALPRGAAMGDLDHDGDSDLVIAQGPAAGPTSLLVHLQTAGAFAQVAFPSMPGVEDVQLVDLDGDGHLDAVAAAAPAIAGDDNVLVRRGLGNGLFSGTLETYPVPAGNVKLLAVAQLDGDSQPELIVGTEFDRDVLVLDVVGGVPTYLETHRFGTGVRRLVVADNDADGHDDLLVVGASALQVLRNTRSPWTKLGAPLAGSAGDSLLVGQGTLQDGGLVRISVVGAVPSRFAVLIAGLGEANAPFKGGVLIPTPDVLLPGLPLDSDGGLELLTLWTPGLPPGFPFALQLWQVDAGGPHGFSSTNGLRGTTP